MINDLIKIIMVGLNNKQRKELPENIIEVKRTNNAKELAEIYGSSLVFMGKTIIINWKYNDRYGVFLQFTPSLIFPGFQE